MTDEGLLPLFRNSEDGFTKVNLSGCVNLTDSVVQTIVKMHGRTLKLLNLDDCRNIIDGSLVEIADSYLLISELDVSECGITDSGIAALAGAWCSAPQFADTFPLGLLIGLQQKLSFLGVLGQILDDLNIEHCHGISRGIVDLLVEWLWSCNLLFQTSIRSEES